MPRSSITSSRTAISSSESGQLLKEVHTVNIRVVRAEGLRDPLYLLVWGSLAVSLSWGTQTVTTTVESHTSSPEWNQQFECRMQLSDELTVTLNDVDWSGTNNPVGSQRIKFRDLIKSPKLEVDLVDSNDEEAGKILLLVSTQDFPQDESFDNPRFLPMCVLRGRDLGGPSPVMMPRVTVRMGASEVYQTSVAQGGPSAVWNEDMNLKYYYGTDTMFLLLKDDSAVVGTASMKVDDLLRNPNGMWLTMQDKEMRSVGEVYIALASAGSALSDAASADSIVNVPVRVVRATNALKTPAQMAGGKVTCVVKKDGQTEETAPVGASPNMVWNADFRFHANSGEAMLLELWQDNGLELVGRAVVPEDVLLAGQREVWIPLAMNGKPTGELCLSLTERPLRYRAPLRSLMETVDQRGGGSGW